MGTQYKNIYKFGSTAGPWIYFPKYSELNYTNDLPGQAFKYEGDTMHVSGVTLPLGSGYGTYGKGTSYSAYVKKSNPLTISAKITVTSGTTSSWVKSLNTVTVNNEVYSGCSETLFVLYTFTFLNPIEIRSGASVKVTLTIGDKDGREGILVARPSNKKDSLQAYGSFEYTSESLPDTYTVNFYSGYSTSDIPLPGEVTRIEVPSGQSATPPTLSRDGYEFAGWLGNYTNVTQNENVYATWEAVQPPVPSPIWVRENGKWVRKTDIYKYSQSTKTWSKIE